MDFETYAYYRENGVKYYWGFGTGTSCVFLVAGLIYLVMEYCTQSHLSTEDYESAAQGLKMTRWFKKHTTWLRSLGLLLAELMHKMMFGMLRSSSKSLRWDYMTKDQRSQRRIQLQRRRRLPVSRGQVQQSASETRAPPPPPDKDVPE